MFWERLDTLLHRVHLPIGFVCDRMDLACGITREELRRKVPMSREFAVIPQPIGWTCEHLTITATLPLFSGPPTFSYCGVPHECVMRPLYADRVA